MQEINRPSSLLSGAPADSNVAMLSQKKISRPGGSYKTFKFVQALGNGRAPVFCTPLPPSHQSCAYYLVNFAYFLYKDELYHKKQQQKKEQ